VVKQRLPTKATAPLSFAPSEAAQVDFCAGLMLPDADGVLRRTWAFVMTLTFSRHQYVELVWDQTVAAWLGCAGGYGSESIPDRPSIRPRGASWRLVW